MISFTYQFSSMLSQFFINLIGISHRPIIYILDISLYLTLFNFGRFYCACSFFFGCLLNQFLRYETTPSLFCILRLNIIRIRFCFRFYFRFCFRFAVSSNLSVFYFAFSARMAFNTARTITPTSAKMASHILAIPNAPKSRQSNFTPNANQIF